jgi:hypothetical protein
MYKLTKGHDMKKQKELLQDFERGEKDREADIKTFGEQFVNHYKFKDVNGVRYNVCTIDDMFNILKK